LIILEIMIQFYRVKLKCQVEFSDKRGGVGFVLVKSTFIFILDFN
jgi:hypothetical protein